jgi:succinyl-diaminopimelate desuccinylase
MATDAEPTAKQHVLDEIARRQDEAINLLQDLIRIPSPNPPGNEREIAAYCASYLQESGFEVTQIEPAPDRISNVGRRPGTAGSPALLFNSHLDTFPTGDVANWKHPPYGAEIHDGTIWGIGAKNMKAGLAAAMFASRVIRDAGVELAGDLLISQAADEIALGPLGLKEIVERGLVKADYAIYTESDPPAKVEISHRGLVWVDVTVRGLGKHTKLKGKPTPEGIPVNAIAKMADVIPAIESMEFTGWEPDEYIPGPPVISVNLIEGGQGSNMIADNCTIRCDCRTLPSQTTAGVMRDVERVLDGLRAKDPELRVEAKLANEAHASAISPEEPIVQALLRAIKEVTAEDMPVGGVSSTSDARWLVLNAGIPTAKFEFQDSESGPNEHMAIEHYMNTIRVYAVVALDLLGAG